VSSKIFRTRVDMIIDCNIRKSPNSRSSQTLAVIVGCFTGFGISGPLYLSNPTRYARNFVSGTAGIKIQSIPPEKKKSYILLPEYSTQTAAVRSFKISTILSNTLIFTYPFVLTANSLKSGRNFSPYKNAH